MLVHNENSPQGGALAALHIVEGVERSLSERLTLLRIRGVHVRTICVSRLGQPPLVGPNACALHIPFKREKKFWVPDMRPSALWLIAAYEDQLLVLASGAGAWEYKRVELAQALEKMEEVLAAV